ncbi:MAG TPA: ATP synthase F0 subunit A [Flavobacteriales bacterium]|nr:ATP synthase F0 subunit A [Crocinitomicaceae bacterium]HAE29654.1 ATP synthase F0 subunit A [Flavobacteriales bacterium]
MEWANFQIPLPVMLWTDDGFTCFSSSNFYKEENEAHVHGMEGHAFTMGNEYIMVNEVIYYLEKNGGIHGIEEKVKLAEEADLLLKDIVNLEKKKVEASSIEEQAIIAEEIAAVTKKEQELREAAGLAAPFDLSITKNVWGLLFVMVLMVFIFVRIAKRYKNREGQAPKGIQNLFEPLILFVRDDIALPSIGPAKAEKFTPFLLSVFFFIWFANLLGLIPFLVGFNIAGTMSITLVLAVVVFIITTINGNKNYWSHMLAVPGVPKWVLVLLTPIEILQMFIKPTVLMIRLTANITAGHIIILAFVSLIFLFGGNSEGAYWGVGVGSTVFMIFMYLIEFLVAFLQAYVFTLLAAIYFGAAVEEAHH